MTVPSCASRSVTSCTARRGDDGLATVHGEVVGVPPLLPPDLEHVAVPPGHDQRGRLAAALDDDVGRQRGGVQHLLDLGGGGPLAVEQVEEAGQGGDGRIPGRRQSLGRDEAALLRVVQDEVGEGAADVDSRSPAHGVTSLRGHRREVSGGEVDSG
jgi:hypothetical protein